MILIAAELRCAAAPPRRISLESSGQWMPSRLPKWDEVVSTRLVNNLPAQLAGTVVTGKDATIHMLDALMVSCMCRCGRPMRLLRTLDSSRRADRGH